MVRLLKAYDPKMVVSDLPPGGIDHPGGGGAIRFAMRVLTRQNEVVVDFGEFEDITAYSDFLSLEQPAGNWTLTMKANACNIELLKKIHPGMVVEFYAARNADPLAGLSEIARTDPEQYQQKLGSPVTGVIGEPINQAPSSAFAPVATARRIEPVQGSITRGGLERTAQRLGLTTEEWAAIVSQESSFRQNAVGGDGGRYEGLIQWGESERANELPPILRSLGYSGEEDIKTIPADDQLEAAAIWMESRGYRAGMGRQKAYATINGGNPNAKGIDAFGTVANANDAIDPGGYHYQQGQQFLATLPPDPPPPPVSTAGQLIDPSQVSVGSEAVPYVVEEANGITTLSVGGGFEAGQATPPDQTTPPSPPDLNPVDKDYLDEAEHLLLRGIINQYGRSAQGTGSNLTISGESFGAIYRDANISTDIFALSSSGIGLEIENVTRQQGDNIRFFYRTLADWVENFWGLPTGWEVRTRPLPDLPAFFVRFGNSGSVWANLEAISLRGLFHLFTDHTGAIVWEKLPYSSAEEAVVPGRNWQDLPGPVELPSWKQVRWGDRLSHTGVVNYIKCSFLFSGGSGGNNTFSLPAQAFNRGSIQQYGGPREMQLVYPGSPGNNLVTIGQGENARATWLIDACVLEILPWYDRPVQRLNLSVRGESAWRINTRIQMAEDWHCPDAPQAEYHVVSRQHQIDIAAGSWVTTMDVTRDRRTRYLGIGDDATPSQGLVDDDYWFWRRATTRWIRLGQRGEFQDNLPADNTDPNVIEAPDPVQQTDPAYDAADREPQPETPPSALNLAPGVYTNPAPGAVVTSRFGPRIPPTQGASSVHQGIDLAAPYGTPILAAADGTVVAVGYFGGYGKLVAIEHPDGSLTRYAHLQRIDTRTGQQVRAGQQIATMGSTGVSTGPHLHFEIRRDAFFTAQGGYGTPVDPEPLIGV